ncbi:MAG: response regulator, partial [Mariprofundaceae bacterium]|nr:response regulator [Mariprofundaceae bacterium]
SVTSLLEVSIHKGIELTYNLADQLPMIEADEAQLQQVIMNLVINASDAIGEDSGEVSLTSGVMYADAAYLAQTVIPFESPLEVGDYVYLEVSDTGCGMSKATLEHLFEPFFTTKVTGRGLGMSAIQGIIRGHQGAMTVSTVLGEGTTFRVLFPISQTIQDDVKVTTSTPPASKSSGTVLVVDDDEMIREVATAMLEHMGFDVLEAVVGCDGVAMYRQHQHDIVAVLLDLTMPKLNGEGCFRELKSINPHVKVMISSGYNEQDIAHRFTGEGAFGFIQKPYKPADLESMLREVCAG